MLARVRARASGSSPRVRGKPGGGAWPRRRWRLIPACAGKTTSSRATPAPPRAHPRVCGENRAAGPGQRENLGSSPRVRGKPADPRRPPGRRGLIPACAGKTTNEMEDAKLPRAHPRVCGENHAETRPNFPPPGSSPRVRGKHHANRGRGSQGGSSPRVRGKLPIPEAERARRGLIPACAGKTPGAAHHRPGTGAHPRVCGENTTAAACWGTIPGSSPRVRGKPAGLPGRPSEVGLIPACAGKTPPSCALRPAWSAHPRVCGENASNSRRASTRVGSSPRVRGKPHVGDDAGLPHGLIPACAGKTVVAAVRGQPLTAHPRVCGENAGDIETAVREAGSSPRVRGKPGRRARATRGPRLISACAGKTTKATAKQGKRPAHPRVCGENARICKPLVVSFGSSPRVRGKLGGWGVCVGWRRLIPACAGKTGWWMRSISAPPAHPRVCGENRTRSGTCAWCTGSSPRVRGKREGLSAGVRIARAHPRVCGENPDNDPADMCADGSSPRVRGKRGDQGPPAGGGGLIPACAGKTGPPRPSSSLTGAHPRVCGENAMDGWVGRVCGGSSPRVRGKPTGPKPHGRRPGLIPACAGKTTGRARDAPSARAHPRVCGENLTPAGRYVIQGGSSPRVRGKRRGAPEREAHGGLIPACAGKTCGRRTHRRKSTAHPRVCGENR